MTQTQQRHLPRWGSLCLLFVLGLTFSGCGNKKQVTQDNTDKAIMILERIDSGKKKGEKEDDAKVEKDLDSAMTLLDEAIAADPSFDKPVCAKGTLFRLKGQNEKASTWYKKAIKLNPDYVVALDNLGYVQVQMGQLDEAEESLNAALRLDKENRSSIHWNLALLFEKRGDKETTAEHLKHFLSLEPDTDSVFYKEAEEKLKSLGAEQ